MKGYIVFTREKTIDPAELAIYWDQIRATFQGHEIKVLAVYGKHEVLEGTPTEGVEVRKHRQNGAIYRGIIVEGV